MKRHLISRTLLRLGLITCLTACQIKDTPLAISRQKNIPFDLRDIYNNTALPETPLTFEDAALIAIDRNLDLQVKELEWEIQQEVATQEKLKMLPGLLLSAERSHRNKNLQNTANSERFGFIATPSTSVQKKVRRWDTTLTLSLLDFGIAYYRSQAEKNRALVTYFQYVRLQHNLILDVSKAYWKAITARKAAEGARKIIIASRKLQETIQKDYVSRIVSALSSLKVQDQMLSFQLRLASYEDLYYGALAELAALMGIPANISFELADVKMDDPDVNLCIDELEQTALENRPELYGTDLNDLVTLNEVRAAVVQLFPRADYFLGFHNNLDKFLVHHHWYIAGITVAWNLLGIPQQAAAVAGATIRNQMAKRERLALSVGVISQVRIAQLKFDENAELYRLNREANSVKQKLLYSAEKALLYGEFSPSEVLIYAEDALIGEINEIQAYGDMQISLEQLNNSIGIPLFFNVSNDINCQNDQEMFGSENEEIAETEYFEDDI